MRVKFAEDERHSAEIVLGKTRCREVRIAGLDRIEDRPALGSAVLPGASIGGATTPTVALSVVE